MEESIKIIHLNTKQILDKVYRVENNFNEEIQNLRIEYSNKIDKIEEQLISNIKNNNEISEIHESDNETLNNTVIEALTTDIERLEVNNINVLQDSDETHFY